MKKKKLLKAILAELQAINRNTKHEVKVNYQPRQEPPNGVLGALHDSAQSDKWDSLNKLFDKSTL
jgi:hypothetical protein